MQIPFLTILPLLIALFSTSCQEPVVTEKENGTISPIQSEHTSLTTEKDTSINLNYLLGHFNPKDRPDFIEIPRAYTDGDGKYYLRKDTWGAFQKMADAAQADGVKLTIRSATRNFARQKQIWEGKWLGNRKIENGKDASKAYPIPKDRALKILEYSSMPGTSRHHWGTDMDLNNFTNEYFDAGEGKKVYSWLIEHAASYGFCQPYTPKGALRPEGYNEEKWHWSYMPVAKKLLSLAQSQFSNEKITGFQGAETAIEIDVVKKYVLGVNKECY